VSKEEDGFSHTINLQFNKTQSMRYGENPHQSAAFYIEKNMLERTATPHGLACLTITQAGSLKLRTLDWPLKLLNTQRNMMVQLPII
jgi:hypothetical protein